MHKKSINMLKNARPVCSTGIFLQLTLHTAEVNVEVLGKWRFSAHWVVTSFLFSHWECLLSWNAGQVENLISPRIKVQSFCWSLESRSLDRLHIHCVAPPQVICNDGSRERYWCKQVALGKGEWSPDSHNMGMNFQIVPSKNGGKSAAVYQASPCSM